MADFGTKRLFMLYGPGGVGKTSVVNIIASYLAVAVLRESNNIEENVEPLKLSARSK